MEKAAEAILSDLGCTDAELSIVVVDDEEMRHLNEQYRNVAQTTDVLSFPMREGEFPEIAAELLGDIVISAPTAAETARRQGCPLQVVLDLLLVHGILHLLGYDHDTPQRASRMDDKTLALMKRLGHTDSDIGWYRTTRE